MEGGCAQGGLKGDCRTPGCGKDSEGAGAGLGPGLREGLEGGCPKARGAGRAVPVQGVPKAEGKRNTVPLDGTGWCTAPSTARPSAPTTGGATSAARATTRAGTPVSVSGAGDWGAVSHHGCPQSSLRTPSAWPCLPSSLQPGVCARPLRRSRAVPVRAGLARPQLLQQ